ncbi:methyltransferase [Streptomyces griseocarneus]|nr:methyltransferase [Streptomyces griseocarneus]
MTGAAGPSDPSASDGYANGLFILGRMARLQECHFTLLGRSWELLPGVFPPTVSAATAFYSRALPFRSGTAFLEIGCGSGVIAVQAALAGCSRVFATDVDASAVENTRRNARRHGAACVTAAVGDVFSAVPPGERYDTVFWNLPYVNLSAGHPDAAGAGRAVFDAGHRCLRAYVQGVRTVLAPEGRVFLGLGNISDHEALCRIADAYGWAVRLRAAASEEPDPEVEHRLYELTDG